MTEHLTIPKRHRHRHRDHSKPAADEIHIENRNEPFDGRPSLVAEDPLLDRLILAHGPRGRADLFHHAAAKAENRAGLSRRAEREHDAGSLQPSLGTTEVDSDRSQSADQITNEEQRSSMRNGTDQAQKNTKGNNRTPSVELCSDPDYLWT